MSDKEITSVMICARRREGLVPVPGSVHADCTKCGTGIWISGEMLFEHPDVPLVCLPCEMPVILEQIEKGNVECPQPEAAGIIEAIKSGLIDPEMF